MAEAEMADEAAEKRLNPRKVREGIAVSTKMDKTVVVAVVDRVRHRRYQKTLQRTKHLYAHDETNDVREGDRVRLAESRPLSRHKRWRIVEVRELDVNRGSDGCACSDSRRRTGPRKQGRPQPRPLGKT